jgi:hypothetical protein
MNIISRCNKRPENVVILLRINTTSMRPGTAISTLVLLTVLVVVGACNKHHDAPPNKVTTAPHNVYVLGSSGDTLEYWNNGAPVTLATATSAGNYLSGMALVNNSVYVTGGGDVNPGTLFGEVWTRVQNQLVQSSSLPDTAGNSSNIHTNGIFVSSTGDVYVAGTVWYNGQSNVPYTTPTASYPLSGYIATYWKNGEAMNLPSRGYLGGGASTSSEHADYVSGIFVNGSDVYVSGGSNEYLIDSATTYQFARYWKNGVSVNLSGGLIDSSAGGTVTSRPNTTGIFVSGSDVYVSGTLSGSQALYWKNGSPTFLTPTGIGSGAAAQAVVVSGSDVYAAGYVDSAGSSYAVIWKNGASTTLSANPSTANGITVSGDSVYVAGSENVNGKSYATVWANGQATHLGTGGAAWAVAVQ